MLSVESRLNEALAQIQLYENVIVQLRMQLHVPTLLKAQVELEERIAKLPPDAKERLRKAFPSTDLGGLKQAVRVERILGGKK